MWSKWGCGQIFPDITKSDLKIKNIIDKFVENKKVYARLKFIIHLSAYLFTGLKLGIEGGNELFHLLNPEFEFKKHEHGTSTRKIRSETIFNVVTTMLGILSASTLNIIKYDDMLTNINSKSTFITDLYNLEFTGDMNQFELDCDKLFDKEIDAYIAFDYVSLFCVIHQILIDLKIKTYFDIFKKLSPYRNYAPSYDQFKENNKSTHKILHDDITTSHIRAILKELKREHITPTTPARLRTLITNLEGGIARPNTTINRLLRHVRSVMIHLNTTTYKFKKYTDHDMTIHIPNNNMNNAYIMFGYNEYDTSSIKDKTLKSSVDDVIGMKERNKVATHMELMHSNDIKEQMVQKNNALYELLSTGNVTREMKEDMKSIRITSDSFDDEIPAIIDIVSWGVTTKQLHTRHGKVFKHNYLKHFNTASQFNNPLPLPPPPGIVNIVIGNPPRRFVIDPLDNNKITDRNKINGVLIYLNACMDIKNLPIPTIKYKSMETGDIQKVFKDFNNESDTKFMNNQSITGVIFGMKAFWPVFKFFVTMLPRRISSFMWNAENMSRVFDEMLGNLSGLIIGPKYLSQITTGLNKRKYESPYTYAKNIDDEISDQIDPILDDMIASVATVTPSKYKSEEDEKKEEPYSILTDFNDYKMKKETEKVEEIEKSFMAGNHTRIAGNSRICKNRDNNEDDDRCINKKFILSKRGGSRKSKLDIQKEKLIKKWKDDEKRRLAIASKISTSKKTPQIVINIGNNFKDNAIRTTITQSHVLKNKSKKELSGLKKSSILRGTYTGMIAGKVMPNNLSNKIRRQIHKLLCKLASKTDMTASIFTHTLTLILALIYISSRLSTVVLDHYKRYKHRVRGGTVTYLCEYALPSNRRRFQQLNINEQKKKKK